VKIFVSNRDIIRLAAPVSLSLLIPQLSFLANNIFLGRVGERELGVSGVAGIYYLMLVMVGSGLASGIQIQMARRAGEGDRSGIARVFTNGMLLAAFLSLSLMMLSLWLAPILFGMNMYDEENILYSVSFLYIRVWGLPFIMLTQLSNSFYIATGQSRLVIWQSVSAAAVNILFDYLLIFGKGGLPAMGLDGAATASVMGEIVGCLVAYSVFYFRKIWQEYPLRQHLRFDSELSKRSLRIAAPLIVQFFFSIGGWEVFFLYIEHLGTRELAASQILRSIFGIVGISTWAFAVASSTMVSNVIGQGREQSVLPLVWKIAKLSLTVTATICLLLLLFPYGFLSLYRDDPELVAFAIPSLRVIVLATLIMSVSTVVFNAVVGTGRTLVNLTIEIGCVLTYLLYCYIIIERLRSPLHIAWGSEFVYWTSLLVVSFLYLRSGRWKGKRI
jgi:MATE family multidrug resistance protein